MNAASTGQIAGKERQANVALVGGDVARRNGKSISFDDC